MNIITQCDCMDINTFSIAPEKRIATSALIHDECPANWLSISWDFLEISLIWAYIQQKQQQKFND